VILAFGLFEQRVSQEVDANSEIADDHYNQELTQDSRSKMEDMFQLNQYLVDIPKIKRGEEVSRYLSLVTKESKTSNLSEEDRHLVHKWRTMLNYAVYFDLPEFTETTLTELIDFLATSSSVGGFERLSLISTISQIKKATGALEPQTRKLI
jgi:hypothetical protein